MKIKKPGDPQTDLNLVQQRQQRAQAQNQANASAIKILGGGSDTVQLSTAREVNAISSGDTDKVARIKALVESGNYKIDSTVLAKKLSEHIDEEINFQALLGNED